jgi:hypothetical protein
MVGTKKNHAENRRESCSWTNNEGGVGSIQSLQGIWDSIRSTSKGKAYILPAPISLGDRGLPSNMTTENETEIFSNVTEMQSIGFGLNAIDVTVCVSHKGNKK